MKRIKFHNIETIFSFDKGNFYSLVFEDIAYAYHFVSDITKQLDLAEEGPIIYSEGDSIKEASKKMALMTDLYRLDSYDKAIHTALQKHTVRVSNQCDLSFEMNRMGEAYLSFMEKISHESNVSFEYDLELEISSILKLANVRIDRHSSNLLDGIVEYMGALTSLLGIDIFLILGLKQHLTQQQLEELIHEIKGRKINVISIETVQSSYSIQEEVCVLIDNDLCEIVTIT